LVVVGILAWLGWADMRALAETFARRQLLGPTAGIKSYQQVHDSLTQREPDYWNNN